MRKWFALLTGVALAGAGSVNAAGKCCGVPIDKSSSTQWHTFGVNRQSTYTQLFLDGVRQATSSKAHTAKGLHLAVHAPVLEGPVGPRRRLRRYAGGSRSPVTTSVDRVRR